MSKKKNLKTLGTSYRLKPLKTFQRNPLIRYVYIFALKIKQGKNIFKNQEIGIL